jgi:tRNA(Ile)-lysidine synthase
MLEIITSYIEQHQLLPTEGQLLVAVSGGADSLCLLHLLNRLCGPDKRYPDVHVHAAHLNHKLRGGASEQDAAAVSAIVTSWGIPITIGEVDVPALAREERRSLEDAARTARYRFLRTVAQGQLIAVAHHADDQVETLLLHWLRGGGLAGMVGMLPRQQDIIRPLLSVTHADTVAYCQQHNIVPLEDASNIDLRFTRNRIRHELLPLLESLHPGGRSTLLRNAEALRVDLAWIEAQIDASWSAVVTSEGNDALSLRLSALRSLPQSLQRHLLRRVTAKLSAGQSPLELRHYVLIEQLLQREDAEKEYVLHLPNQLLVTRNFNTVIFARHSLERQQAIFSANTMETLLPVPGSIEVVGTPWIATAEMLSEELQRTVRGALQDNDWLEVWRILSPTRYAVYVDGDVVGRVLHLRTRQPGDRMRPLGMTAEKKIQDILVDNHIPRSERASLPLFFVASHCAWVAGVCLDDRVRLTDKTQHIVRLSIDKKRS